MHYTSLNHYAIVTGLAECARAELALTDAGEPDRVCVVPGTEIAWDNCQCGQLAIATTRVFPSNVFPIQSVEFGLQGNCGLRYTGVDIDISITRCVPGPDNNGNPPSCEDLAAATKIMYDDSYAVWRSITCCLQEMRENMQIAEFLVRSQPSTGPQGGCAGSTLSVTIGYAGGGCCGS